MGNIFRLFERTNNAKQWSVEDVLKEKLAEVVSGKFPETAKVVVIILDDMNGRYDHSFTQCGMNTGELVALLETVKTDVIIDTKKVK